MGNFQSFSQAVTTRGSTLSCELIRSLKFDKFVLQILWRCPDSTQTKSSFNRPISDVAY